MLLALNSIMRHDIDARVAHDILRQYMQTMLRMYACQKGELGVVFWVDMASQDVEAVDLVEGADLDEVCVWAIAPFDGRANCDCGVFSEFDDVECGDGVVADHGGAFPGIVNFWTWRLALD